MNCHLCHIGVLEPTGMFNATYPPQWYLQCSECKRFFKAYIEEVYNPETDGRKNILTAVGASNAAKV